MPKQQDNSLDINTISDLNPAEATGEFFEKLDASINIDVDDITLSGDSEQKGEATPQKAGPEKTSPNYDFEKLDKRYRDSSREARRLNNRLKELEPFTPILDELRRDPQLREYVKAYYIGKSQNTDGTSSDWRKSLDLDEDFVFDMDEAVKNPNSDSGRVLSKMMESFVDSKLNQFAQQQEVKMTQAERRAQLEMEQTRFRQDHPEMTDEEYEDFVGWTKSTPLTLEKSYYLYNMDTRDRNIASHAREDMAKQMANVRKKPASISTQASARSQESEKSVDDQVIDMLLGIDKDFEEAIGMQTS